MESTIKRTTVYDPEGEPFEMVWDDDLQFDADNWCSLCDHTITEGWVADNSRHGLLILCDTCAQANATTEGR